MFYMELYKAWRCFVMLCFVFVIVVFSFSHYIILDKYTTLWNKNSEGPWGSEKPNTYNKMIHNKDT